MATKADLVNTIAEQANLTKKDARDLVNLFQETVVSLLHKEGKVALPDFGTFTVIKREEHKGRNPQTGEEIVIPVHNVVKFKSGKRVREEFK